MDDWETSFLLGRPICRCVLVSFSEGTFTKFSSVFLSEVLKFPKTWCCDTGPSLPEVSVSKSTGTVPTGTPGVKMPFQKNMVLPQLQVLYIYIYTLYPGRRTSFCFTTATSFEDRLRLGKQRSFPLEQPFFRRLAVPKIQEQFYENQVAKTMWMVILCKCLDCQYLPFKRNQCLWKLGKGFDS